MLPNKNENLLLNDRWLRLAEFWTNHREGFRKTIIVSIVTFEVLLFIYISWLLLGMYVLNAERDARTMAQLTTFPDYTLQHPRIIPQPLSVPVATVLAESANGGKYDVLLRFSNPNPNWYADVTYEAGDVRRSARVLNDQERLIIVPGAATSLSGIPAISVVDVDWRRIRNVQELARITPNLEVKQVAYSASGDNPGRVSFDLVNDSLFNFWEVDLTVVLLQGTRAIAARQVQIKELLEGEEREVLVNFFGGVGSVTDVLILPFVDVVNPGVFKDIEAPPIQF